MQYVVRLSETLWLAGFNSETGEPIVAEYKSNATKYATYDVATVAAINADTLLSIVSTIEPA